MRITVNRSRPLLRSGCWLLVSLGLMGGQKPARPDDAPAAGTTANVLTLPAAIARALERQPAVTAARQRARQAEFRLRGALAFPSTLIDIGHGRILTLPGASGSDQDILITQRFDLFGQRRLRGDLARRELEAARAGLAQAEAEVTFRVRSAYVLAQSAAAEEALARQVVAVAEIFNRLANAQYRAGQVPIASVLRSEIEVENAGQALLAAETGFRVQRAALNAALAQPVETDLALPAIEAVPLHTYDFAELQALALKQPALRAAEATLAARRSAVSVARAARLPDFTIQGAHDQIQTWPGGNVVRIGFTIPIWDHGIIRAAVGEARAAVAEQQANVEVLRQQATLDVTTAYYNLEQLRRLAERTGGAQLQRATRLYQLSRISFSEGLTSYLDLLDAQQVLRNTLTAYLRALAGYEAAEAGLQRALGAPLPAPKSTTPFRYEPPVLEIPARPQGQPAGSPGKE